MRVRASMVVGGEMLVAGGKGPWRRARASGARAPKVRRLSGLSSAKYREVCRSASSPAGEVQTLLRAPSCLHDAVLQVYSAMTTPVGDAAVMAAEDAEVLADAAVMAAEDGARDTGGGQGDEAALMWATARRLGDRRKEQIAALDKERKALQAQRKRVNREMAQEESKRQRLIAAAKHLSTIDLQDVLRERAAAEVAREVAKAKAKGRTKAKAKGKAKAGGGLAVATAAAALDAIVGADDHAEDHAEDPAEAGAEDEADAETSVASAGGGGAAFSIGSSRVTAWKRS